MTTRITLADRDGKVFLDRWGLECRFGGVFLHRIGPDPTPDLHDHPWSFVSLILWGGYAEQRNRVELASESPEKLAGYRGAYWYRYPFSIKRTTKRTCHRIVQLLGPSCWTLVVHGRKRATHPGSSWGFYTPDGYVDHIAYEATRSGEQRGVSWRVGGRKGAWQTGAH